MKFLTVAAAIFASTSLAVPTNNHNDGGGCVPRPDPGNSNTSSSPGGNPTGGHTSSDPGTKPTDGNTRSGPGTKPTGGHTSSGPGTKPTDGNTRSGPGTKPTGSHTISVPATTTTGSNTDPHTISGPSTTSTSHFGSGGGVNCPAGLYSNLQCCESDVLGLADLNCSPPRRTPTSGDEFRHICAEIDRQAKCCVLPVASLGALCLDPIPVGHPTSVPGGHPTSAPGGNPTPVAGHSTPPSGGNPFHPCPSGLYSIPQCCSTDVFGIADLDCFTPKDTLISANSFKNICAAVGQQARCCLLPVADQAVLCQKPVGI